MLQSKYSMFLHGEKMAIHSDFPPVERKYFSSPEQKEMKRA